LNIVSHTNKDPFPEIYRIRQRFDDTQIASIGNRVRETLGALRFSEVKPGDRVAITGGSRGIAHFADIIRHIVLNLKDLGAVPFIFPAMGSHGGATADGQAAMLKQLGLAESSVGAPIVSAMDVVEIGCTDDGVPVFLDQHAAGADHIVVVNRIKSHTKFKAPVESGLMKMMAIGMGKQKGAEYYHKAAIQHTFPKIIMDAARVVMARAPVLCGVGIVENGHGETAHIEAIPKNDIESREKSLLKLAKQMAPSLPFHDIDLLIVDEMGKDISGVGIDPNVTGRNRDLLGRFEHPVSVKRLFVRDLTERSHGNATGIGLSDVTTRRLVDKIDFDATYRNAITAISLEKAAIPMHFKTDREALAACLGSIGLTPVSRSRIVRIKNTLELELVEVSEVYLDLLGQRPDLEVVAGPYPLVFDKNGNLGGP
jgi:Lactate racemase N-terminal domain